MARPVGSTSKPFRDALRLVLAEAEGVDDNDPKARRKLRRLAERLLDLAGSGCLQSLREVADRVDGKVPQGVGQDAELGPLTVKWLDPAPEMGREHAPASPPTVTEVDRTRH